MIKKLLVLLVGIVLLVGVFSGCVEEETPTNTAPEASYTYTKDGLTVTFTDASTDADDNTLTYTWDFGDDTGTSNEANPTYIYTANGIYTVKLTVNDGTDEHTYEETIIVGNFAPTAAFTYTADNLTVTFTDGSFDPNHDELTYEWDFEKDGIIDNTTQGPVENTYVAAGTYNVTLTVTDPEGLTGSITKEIEVTEATE